MKCTSCSKVKRCLLGAAKLLDKTEVSLLSGGWQLLSSTEEEKKDQNTSVLVIEFGFELVYHSSLNGFCIKMHISFKRLCRMASL